jgi:hypothetical protein
MYDMLTMEMIKLQCCFSDEPMLIGRYDKQGTIRWVRICSIE